MKRAFWVVLAAAVMVALPFIFRRPSPLQQWSAGDPVLVIISPHNEAIREEFARAFSEWHARRYGCPVKVDWRSIGGTTEIMRYLESEYVGSMRAWWEREGRVWPAAGATWILDRRFDPVPVPQAAKYADWEAQRELYLAFRTNDAPDLATSRMDLFFGGGVYDHNKAGLSGLTVAPWGSAADIPEGLFRDGHGRELIPAKNSGEKWCGETFFGTVLSTFGICYNPDRLQDLGITKPPQKWVDLTDHRYFGQIGVADPTKSGSVAKAFEMIIQQACWETVRQAGFSDAQVFRWEAALQQRGRASGQPPSEIPVSYQEAVAQGWINGLNRVRLIGANARYFTDSAGKVPIDVGMGATAAGIAIDFFGRFQSEYTRVDNGTPHMFYTTPVGGSSVSADPISLLRGARHRELALRFIVFCLSEEGQKLWNYRVGEPGGPQRYALRRLPIRRDFYPGEDAAFEVKSQAHRVHTSDDLADPAVNPYALARAFHYQARWTGAHFGIQRDLVRALCLDSGDELRAAWGRIQQHGGAAQQPAAMAWLLKLPQNPLPVTWESALTEYAGGSIERLEYMRLWTAEMRANYRQAYASVQTAVAP